MALPGKFQKRLSTKSEKVYPIEGYKDYCEVHEIHMGCGGRVKHEIKFDNHVFMCDRCHKVVTCNSLYGR